MAQPPSATFNSIPTAFDLGICCIVTASRHRCLHNFYIFIFAGCNSCNFFVMEIGEWTPKILIMSCTNVDYQISVFALGSVFVLFADYISSKNWRLKFCCLKYRSTFSLKILEAPSVIFSEDTNGTYSSQLFITNFFSIKKIIGVNMPNQSFYTF